MARFKIDDRVETSEALFPRQGYVEAVLPHGELTVEFDEGDTRVVREHDLYLLRPACPFHGRGRCDLCE